MNFSFESLPTFIGSSILFIAASTILVACAGEIYSTKTHGNDGKLTAVYRSVSATRFRKSIARAGTLLIFIYLTLYLLFGLKSYDKYIIGEGDSSTLGPFDKMVHSILPPGHVIYFLEITLFPIVVLIAAFFMRWYISLRSSQITNT